SLLRPEGDRKGEILVWQVQRRDGVPPFAGGRLGNFKNQSRRPFPMKRFAIGRMKVDAEPSDFIAEGKREAQGAGFSVDVRFRDSRIVFRGAEEIRFSRLEAGALVGLRYLGISGRIDELEDKVLE